VNESSKQNNYNEYDNFAFHPYNILLVLLLSSIGALFIAFSAAFVYTRVQSGLPPVKLPNLFFFNTFVLLTTSVAMRSGKFAYKNDKASVYQRALFVTLLLTFLFLGLQISAWMQLFDRNVFLTTDNSASYLYLLSGLHFIHVVAGLPFLFSFLLTARKRLKEPVSGLVYFSDPAKSLKLRLLSIYWHFLDGLWLYLLLFFQINYWFS